MKIYQTSKKVISVKNNPEKFLNGITSNELTKAQNAFLNIHGKIIAIFDQFKKSDDEYWLVVEESFVQAVMDHAEKFSKLSHCEMVLLDKKVYFNLDVGAVHERPDVSILQKRGELVVTSEDLEVNVTEEEFIQFRLDNNIPQHGIDYFDDFILNVSGDDFVSFTKGCFLGQEPVSKVYNRSKPTWKLVVKNVDECSDEKKQKMTSVLNGKGFVFVKNE